MSKRNKPVKTVSIDSHVPQRQSPLDYVLAQQKFRTRQDIASLRIAIESANNTTNYSRYLLHQVFREVIADTMVSSQWESRKMKTKEKKFKMVNADGKENEELTKIFKASWFTDWQDAVIDRKMWGFSLVEFGPWDGKKFTQYTVDDGTKKRIYDPVTVIDRDNVKPEFGIITKNYGDSEGVSFSEPEYKDYLMFAGHTHDFGLLFKLAKYVLYKNNCLGNWSEWIEVFGMDKRVGYTMAQDTARTNFMKALRDLGNNSYGVFGKDDKVEYIGSARTDAYSVYLEFLKYIDSQISKVIFGQDVVSNNTGHVIGEVGENISNMYGDTDAAELETMVNEELIPLMEKLGANFHGHTFQWDNEEKLTMTERKDIDASIVKDMGKRLTDEYVEGAYGVMLDETPEEPDPSMAIKKTYE